MSFTGNPGTGKTAVALRIASILHKLGFVRRGQVVWVTPRRVGGTIYIGHTAQKSPPNLLIALGQPTRKAKMPAGPSTSKAGIYDHAEITMTREASGECS